MPNLGTAVKDHTLPSTTITEAISLFFQVEGFFFPKWSDSSITTKEKAKEKGEKLAQTATFLLTQTATFWRIAKVR